MDETNGVPDRSDELARATRTPVQEDPPDDLLVAALQAGHRNALGILYSRYYREMVDLANGYVHNSATAEEVVQDSWAAVLEGLKKFEGKCSFKSWVLRILINKARRRWRRESRLSAIKRLLQFGPESGESPLFDASSSWALPPTRWRATPEDLLLSDEFRREMREFVASLPPRQRQVFILRNVEGCPSESVCKRLGITAGNQRLLLHRARLALYRWYSARTQDRTQNIAGSHKGFTP